MDVTHVLCPISTDLASHASLETAASAAAALGVPLTVFSAVDDQREVSEREAALDFLLEEAGIEATTQVAAAEHPPTAIVAFAGDDALVVMSTTTRMHLLAGYVGSATEHVIRSVRRPVLTVGPNATCPLDAVTGVLVPCDGSKLSEAAVPVGRSWADRLGVDLTVVSMIDPSMGGPSETNYVHRIASDVGAQWDVLHGDDPAEAIAAYGSKQLIVMTTHGRSGFSRLRLGSVVTETTRLADAPVVALAPASA